MNLLGPTPPWSPRNLMWIGTVLMAANIAAMVVLLMLGGR